MIKLIIFLITITCSNTIPFQSQAQTSIREYEHICKIDASIDIEIRKYKKSMFASYYSKEEKSQNNYFRILAGYIFGDNEKKEKIDMTSPVQIKLNDNKDMLFRMPAKYNSNNIPKPNNKAIKIIEKKERKVAVIKFSGYAREKNIKKNKKILIEKLKENKIIYDDKFELWVYDDPFKIKNRRNEIVVNIYNDMSPANE